jgi:hypothetical protein
MFGNRGRKTLLAEAMATSEVDRTSSLPQAEAMRASIAASKKRIFLWCLAILAGAAAVAGLAIALLL